MKLTGGSWKTIFLLKGPPVRFHVCWWEDSANTFDYKTGRQFGVCVCTHHIICMIYTMYACVYIYSRTRIHIHAMHTFQVLCKVQRAHLSQSLSFSLYICTRRPRPGTYIRVTNAMKQCNPSLPSRGSSTHSAGLFVAFAPPSIACSGFYESD